MQVLKKLSLIMIALFLFSCGEDGTSFTFQSQRCNDGDQATLALNVTGVGAFTFTDGSSAVSHASDTEDGGTIDAISMYMRWVDPVTGDSIIFDITVEYETLAETTYNWNAASFNGTVNFYIYTAGVLQAQYLFSDWQTTINEFEVYETTSGGGFTNTRLAFVNAATSGTFTKVGVGSTHAFTSTYTICPRY